MQVNVQASHDKKFPLEVVLSDSTDELKKKIGASQDIPPEEIRLIFSGRILKDTDTVESLKMTEGNVLHMVRSAKAAKPAATNPAPQAAQPPVIPSLPTQGGAASGMSPNNLAQMFGGMGMPSGFGGGSGSGDGDMASMMNNPAMQSMMNNPEMMRQTMDMMAANPQLMQSILQMNPTFRTAPPHVQQMMQRPEFMRMMLEMSMSMPPPTGSSPSSPMPMGGNDPQFHQYMQTLESMIGASPPQQQSPSEPPEVRFQSQLQQLTEMGFYDPDANIRALLATGGNVNLAIERLLQNM